MAKHFYDCGPDPEEFCERFHTVLQLPRNAVLRLETVPDRSLLRFYWKQAWRFPIVDPASPIELVMSEVVFASAGDSSIPLHHPACQIGRQSKQQIPSKCSGDTELR